VIDLIEREILSRVGNLVKLYRREFEGHLTILLCGEIEISDIIFKKREELDMEIRNLLKAKEGQLNKLKTP